MPDAVKEIERVVLTSDALGGVWTYTVELARQYDSRGIEVVLVVIGPSPSQRQRQDLAGLDRVRLVPVDLPFEWTARSQDELTAAAEKLAGMCSLLEADVLHINNPGLVCAGEWSMPIVAGIHSCVKTWWLAVRGAEPMPQDISWRSDCIGQGLDRAQVVVTPSRAFAEAVHQAYGEHVPVLTVLNGRTPVGPEPKNSECTALTSGRLWDDAKNVRVLDEVAGMLPVPVCAAGPIVAPTGGIRTFRNLRLLGELSSEDMLAWLRRTTIYVSPALYEPFGLGVLEAASAGCALVLSDIPTFRELWSGAARFVDPQDPKAIAAEIKRLADSQGDRLSFGRAAAARAGEYGPGQMADGTLAAYGLARQSAAAGGSGAPERRRRTG